MKINDYRLGATVVTRLVLSEAAVRQTNTKVPRDYLAVTLTDGNEEIKGKMWNWSGLAPEPKKVYDIVADVGEYLDKKQLTLTKINLSSDQDMTDFVKSVGVPKGLLYDSLLASIESIANTKLKTIVQTIYGDLIEDILAASAAKNIHHVGIGGLAQHTIEVFNVATAICDANSDRNISVSLVQAGALLHDIGKIATYEQEGPVVDMSLDGHLFEHIVVGLSMLQSLNKRLGPSFNDEITLLKHIIASHHGQVEYGSPVTPKFMEAYIVNYADQISSTFDTIQAANEKTTGELTEKIYTCNNRQHLTQATVSAMLER